MHAPYIFMYTKTTPSGELLFGGDDSMKIYRILKERKKIAAILGVALVVACTILIAQNRGTKATLNTPNGKIPASSSRSST